MLKFTDEYRDKKICSEIAEKIRSISSKKINIMEVCGGHTMAIRKNGLHKLVGDNIRLLSGPGCPVCVTSEEDIDTAIALSESKDVIICTFGDLFHVPGTLTSLSKKRSSGSDVRVVYSVRDAFLLAKATPDKKVVFISIGFETTTPTIAAVIKEAYSDGVENFFVLALNKTMPNALGAILSDESSKIDAVICPGHVSSITGTSMYKPIVNDFGVSCCVSGFEPMDVLASIYFLVESCEKEKPELFNQYKRAVTDDGNETAISLMNDIFEANDTEWRGLGVIKNSGLKIRDKYAKFDALKKIDFKKPSYTARKTSCSCGDILKGIKSPSDCGLFGKTCTPREPKGSCMVSSEGVCAAWYKYGD